MIRSTEPKLDHRAGYPIGEAAAILGLSRSTMTKYANLGLVRYSVDCVSGRKIFRGEALLKLWRRMRS